MTGVPLVWLAALEAVLVVTLIACAAVVWRIDMRRMIIPDTVTLVLLPAGLLHAWAMAGAPISGSLWDCLPHAAISGAAVFGWGFFLLRFVFSHAYGQEALGLGDVKLAFAVGAWIGTDYFLLYLLMTSAAALATYLAIVVGRLFRPMWARPDAAPGAGWRAHAGAWWHKRWRPPRAYPYGPAMAVALVAIVLGEKAGWITGWLGLAPVWEITRGLWV